MKDDPFPRHRPRKYISELPIGVGEDPGPLPKYIGIGGKVLPQKDDPAYLSWLRSRPCDLLWFGGCMGRMQAHHEPARGTGSKGDDRFTNPLCLHHHDMAHKGMLEIEFLGRKILLRVYLIGEQRKHIAAFIDEQMEGG